jgi:hypothetical protein
MITPIGRFIYPYYDFLRLLTALVYYIELLIPFLLFIPFYNSWFRMASIIIIIIMQINIYLTMNVGLFSITSIVAMIALTPTYFMNILGKKFHNVIHKWKTDVNRFMLRFANPTVNETIPPPGSNFIADIFVLFCLLYVLGWNINTTGKQVIPDNQIWIGHFLRIHQHWSMFAPAVYKDDGWFILSGTTSDGRKIDLVHGEAINYEKPERVADLIKNDRWRKYSENILLINNSHFRPFYCNFLLNQWNNAHAEHEYVIDLQIIYMLEHTLPDYKTKEINPLIICTCSVQL